MLKITVEEKTAIKIVHLITDFMADPTAIGYYLARVAPKTAIDRMARVYESAQQEYARIEQQEKLRQEVNNGYLFW